MKRKISIIMLLTMILMLSLNSFAFAEETAIDGNSNVSNLVENTEGISRVFFGNSNEIEYLSNGGATILNVEGLGKVQFDCYGVAIIDGVAQKISVPSVITIKKVNKVPENNLEAATRGLTYQTTYEFTNEGYVDYYQNSVWSNTKASIEVYKDSNNTLYYDLNQSEYWLERGDYGLTVQNAKLFAAQYGRNTDNDVSPYEYISPSYSSLWDNSNDVEGHHYIRTESGTFTNWRPVSYFDANCVGVKWYQGDVYYNGSNTGLDISSASINCPM